MPCCCPRREPGKRALDGERPDVTLGKKITCRQVADLMGLEGKPKTRVQAARRELRSIGIDRQNGPGKQVYTTMADLQDKAAHLWAAAVAKGMS